MRTPGARRSVLVGQARSAGRRPAARGLRARRASGTCPRARGGWIRTAPISQIRAEACERPVVSRSKTTNSACLERRVGSGGERDERAAPREPRVVRRRAARAACARVLPVPGEPRRGGGPPRLPERGRRVPRRARPADRASRSQAASREANTNICSLPVCTRLARDAEGGHLLRGCDPRGGTRRRRLRGGRRGSPSRSRSTRPSRSPAPT